VLYMAYTHVHHVDIMQLICIHVVAEKAQIGSFGLKLIDGFSQRNIFHNRTM